MGDFCAKFTEDQAKAHKEAGEWDDETKIGMLRL